MAEDHRMVIMKRALISSLLLLSLLFSLCSCLVAQQSSLSSDDTLPHDTTEKKEETTTAPDTEPVVIDTSVTISMVGDVLLHEKVADSGKMADGTYNYDHMFTNVKDKIESADISIVNQEVILGGKDLGLTGYPSFNGAFEVGDALVNAGFDIILHATNHTLDKGARAVRNCLDFWRTEHPGISVLGINSSAEEQSNIYIREENGIKIAFLNYTYGTNGIPLPSDMPYAVNLLNEQTLRRDIAKAEAEADFTVVLPHWGTEYILEPDSNQKYWSQIMFDCGVDLVIGTHPHVIEPIEIIENGEHSMLVYYSIGNFINATAETGAGIANRMVGGIANVTIDKAEDGSVEITDYGVTPIVTHVLTGSGRITTYLLSEYTEELAGENEIIASDPAFSLSYCKELADRVFKDNQN